MKQQVMIALTRLYIYNLLLLLQCKMNFITVKSTAILSKFFGETEATLRRLFQKARDAAPCVLFFDEFDAIAHNRYR